MTPKILTSLFIDKAVTVEDLEAAQAVYREMGRDSPSGSGRWLAEIQRIFTKYGDSWLKSFAGSSCRNSVTR
jgi:hypothetical protein